MSDGTDLIDDQQRRMREDGETLRQSSSGLSLLERGNQIDQGAVVHPSSALCGTDRQIDCQVGLADARRRYDKYRVPYFQALLAQARKHVYRPGRLVSHRASPRNPMLRYAAGAENSVDVPAAVPPLHQEK